VVDPNLANTSSGLLFFDIPKPLNNDSTPSKVHNGGSMHFGPDGYLYISTGDGGPDPWVGSGQPGDPNNNSQRRDVLLGKILRINVNGDDADCGVGNYSIPPDNPYAGNTPGLCNEIWARGLRNPWRMSFDRETGELFIGDVGEWQYEEVNYQAAGAEGGANYGWHCYEGTVNYVLLYPEIAPQCQLPQSSYTFPIFQYTHDVPPCSSITGGYVYRGSEFPGIYGQYLFADFCTGRVWRTMLIDGVWDTVLLADLQVGVSTFGEDANGELYIGSFMSGTVYKIVP
jgi:glucose/arabinose dehydrogenase